MIVITHKWQEITPADVRRIVPAFAVVMTIRTATNAKRTESEYPKRMTELADKHKK